MLYGICDGVIIAADAVPAAYQNKRVCSILKNRKGLRFV